MIRRTQRQLLSVAKKAKHTVDAERRQRVRGAPIDPNAVLYESFAGNGMLCNPEAIFRSALAADDLRALRHVWALTDPADIGDEFADDPRVTFVKRGSQHYYAELAKAKYLINNATFPEPFAKRPGQMYLNTWHGTPVKAMGYDVPHGALHTGNVVRNLVSADYLLAPNTDTEHMYLRAYRMANMFRGRTIAAGTPRIDRQFADAAQWARTRTQLKTSETERIVLYAPTWRGDFYAPDDDIAKLRAQVESLIPRLRDDTCRLKVKVHQRVYARARTDPRLHDVLVPNKVPTNEILSVVDVLITDYSSIFVDFLVTGRPVLFLAPDLDDYAAERGFYLPPEQWPGPVCRDVPALARSLDDLAANGYQGPAAGYADAYAAARERYCPREDGHAAERVVDIVLRESSDGRDLRTDFADGRTSLLVNLGGLLPNGITTSGLSLLDNIDHDRFDVSVCFARSQRREQRQSIDLINPHVRLFPQAAAATGSRVRIRALAALNGRRPDRRQVLPSRAARVMRDEWVRSFGASQFDHVIDFSGYEPYWIALLAARTSGSLSIWLHNDMAAEVSNPNRAGRLRDRLRAAVVLYATADDLVSVSGPLEELNRSSLARWAPSARFTHAHNTINADRIRASAIASPPSDGYALDVPTFVTAGRLSPEKNHARLIRAFALVHDDDSRTRLIILGAGPEFERLTRLVDQLRLRDSVTLAGHQSNPYSIMSRANCFVLSSDYEGQPVALLEALTLGLPIVTTAFDAVHGALPEGTGLVVGRDEHALADGMRAFLRGDVPAPHFDAAAYNHAAIEEFYRAIGGAVTASLSLIYGRAVMTARYVDTDADWHTANEAFIRSAPAILESWADFPFERSPRPIVLVDIPVRSGRVDNIPDPDSPSAVEAPVPLPPGLEAMFTRRGAPAGMPPLHITAVEAVDASFMTDRGFQQLSAYQVTLAVVPVGTSLRPPWWPDPPGRATS